VSTRRLSTGPGEGPQAGGIVVFAHGSGGSRHSPRNKRVAEHLQRAGFGTQLLDLLTADEEQLDLRSRELRFDIGLLARRLVGAIDWLAARFGGTELPIGLFGASTSAAAALVAAVARADRVTAVVSRDGRPAASPIGGAADACAGGDR
jgi:putative phosphoribosyl transferase